MSTIAELAEAIPNLTTEELRQLETVLLQTYRARKVGIIYDDGYGIWTEEDQAAAAAQAFALMDEAERADQSKPTA